MKIREIKNTDVFRSIKKYKGKKNGIIYEIIINESIYILAHDIKKDLTYNSLWENKTFESIEEAHKWCEINYDLEKLRNNVGLK